MTSDVTTISICDTEPIVIEGVRAVLEYADDLRLIAEHTSLLDGTESARLLQPGIILIDKGFGIHAVMDWLKILQDTGVPTRAVIWGASMTEVESLRFLQSGAAGVLRKTSPLATLLTCLRTVAAGASWLENSLMQEARRNGRNGHSPLTAREMQVMDLVERGMKNKDIAEALGISTGTVKIHLKHIFEKTGIRGRYGLALTGLKEKGLLAVAASPEAA
jgi:two-component system, NarL family, nitrate/nitrite response regulator NarL